MPSPIAKSTLRVAPRPPDAPPRSPPPPVPPAGSLEAILERQGDYLPLKDRARVRAVLRVLDQQGSPPADLRAHIASWFDTRQRGESLVARLEVAQHTGYILADGFVPGDGRRPWNAVEAADRRGWSTPELRMARNFLMKLPPSLRPASGFRFIQRDRSYPDPSTNGALGGPKGAQFGNTLMLYDMMPSTLLRVTLGRPLFEATLLHELGHAAQAASLDRDRRWREFYASEGRAEAPTAYARVNAEEGFAEAFWLYGMAPGNLKVTSPKTHRFMEKEFTTGLSRFHSWPMVVFDPIRRLILEVVHRGR